MGQLLDCCPPREEAVATVDQAHFDQKAKSETITLSKDCKTVSGKGCAIVNAALHQDKCYYEFTIKKLENGASFCVGVSHRKPTVVAKDQIGDLQESWAFNSSQSTEEFKQDDVISCIFDQSSGRPTLTLKKNDQALPPGNEVKGFKGVVHPALSITAGCEIECNFSIEDDGFKFTPPTGCSGLIPSRSLV